MNIYILSYINFLFCLIFLFLSGYVVYKSFKSLLNWVCAFFILQFSFWSLTFTVLHHPQTTEQAADFVLKFFSFTSFSVAGFLLWFTLIFINKNSQFLKNPYFYALLAAIPIFFSFLTWQGEMMALDKRPYGWGFVWLDSIFPYIYFFQYSLFLFIVFFLLIREYLRCVDYSRRKQVKLILIPSLILYVFGTITNVVIPVLDISDFPEIAHIFAMYWAISLVYAVVKYKLLTISFSAYADEIISVMSEALILVDPKGMILNANQAAYKLFGVRAERMNARNIEEFIENKYLDCSSENKISEEGGVKQITVLGEEKKPISVSFSCFPIKNKDKIVGQVFILADITRLLEAQKNTEQLNHELKNQVKEMENFQKLIVNRELRMVELKKEVDFLKSRLSQAVPG